MKNVVLGTVALYVCCTHACIVPTAYVCESGCNVWAAMDVMYGLPFYDHSGYTCSVDIDANTTWWQCEAELRANYTHNHGN